MYLEEFGGKKEETNAYPKLERKKKKLKLTFGINMDYKGKVLYINQ